MNESQGDAFTGAFRAAHGARTADSGYPSAVLEARTSGDTVRRSDEQGGRAMAARLRGGIRCEPEGRGHRNAFRRAALS